MLNHQFSNLFEHKVVENKRKPQKIQIAKKDWKRKKIEKEKHKQFIFIYTYTVHTLSQKHIHNNVSEVKLHRVLYYAVAVYIYV